VLAVPLFLIFKLVIQLLIVVLSKTMTEYSQLEYDIVFILIMLAFMAYLYIFAPYNYNRFNLWQLLIFASVLWTAILATIVNETEASKLSIKIVLYVGYALTLIFGLAV
jgi:hypothetical protein